MAPGFGAPAGSPALVWSVVSTQVYFKGKLISRTGGAGGGSVQEDVRGSVGSYYPYGEDRVAGAANDAVKFATYVRDSVSGLDYAVNRYHLPGMGRFSSPDPNMQSAMGARPPSWNRYIYVEGDPIKYGDRLGVSRACEPDDDPDCVDGYVSVISDGS